MRFTRDMWSANGELAPNYSLSHSAVSARDSVSGCESAKLSAGMPCPQLPSRPNSSPKCWSSFWPIRQQAVATEDGEVLFDFGTARYSVSGEGKCVLHIWSEERNTVRRVLDAEVEAALCACRCCASGNRSPICWKFAPTATGARRGTSRRATRNRISRCSNAFCAANIPASRSSSFSSSPDLEHSFSPVYTRGLLRAGQSAFAVLGVNAEETQPSVDAALTFGILWMDYQRQQLAGRAQVEGLKLFLPPGRSEIVRQRAANLNAEAAKWQLYELDERSEICESIDIRRQRQYHHPPHPRGGCATPRGNASLRPSLAFALWRPPPRSPSSLRRRSSFAFTDWSLRGRA